MDVPSFLAASAISTVDKAICLGIADVFLSEVVGALYANTQHFRYFVDCRFAL